jgi:hypothetical protein
VKFKFGANAIKNDLGKPIHPFNEGITDINAESEKEVLFIGVNGEIFPVPLIDNPMFELLLFQLNVVPEMLLLKSINEVEAPKQTC